MIKYWDRVEMTLVEYENLIQDHKNLVAENQMLLETIDELEENLNE
ncbi:hypothetical protein [Clostridium sp.]|nr:hypothetical protein [Clostridium sp.]MBK5239788.1 hypothetical protein [Clostridium sp.]